MQASLCSQIRGGGEEQEEIAVWDSHDDQESGFFFFFCGVSAIGFSCGEKESGCGDTFDGEKKKKKKEKMNGSGDDDSAPWTENGFDCGHGEVNGLFAGLVDMSQSGWTLR
jgi:hypothetical protein